MKVGCPQIVIVMMMVMVMLIDMMIIVVMVMMVILQQQRTDDIDEQAQAGNCDRLVELDGVWIEDTLHGFEQHDQCHDSQGHCAGKTAQHAHLSRTEGVLRVLGMLAGVLIGEDRDHEGGYMGAHMPTVCQQCHRTIYAAGNYFDDHGDSSQQQYVAGSPLPLLVGA